MSWFDNFSMGPAQMDLSVFEQGLGALGGWAQSLLGGLTDTSGQTPPAPGGAQAQAPGNQDLSQLLQQLGASAASGYGSSGSGTSNTYLTPDGVTITNGSPEDRFYKLVDAVWSKIYGAHPDFAQAKVFRDMGVQNTDQLQQILLQMPSHVNAPDGTPITIGNYEDMLTTGNKFANQYFGRPVPDSLISQWVAQGLTQPAAIENWFWSHPANDLPKDQYGAAWDAANQWTQQVWGAFKG